MSTKVLNRSEHIEPLRIKIDLNTYQVLKTDRNLFEIKSLNELYNQIVINYYEEYIGSIKAFIRIKKMIHEQIPDINDLKVTEIVKKMHKELKSYTYASSTEEKFISYRPTGNTPETIIEISNNLDYIDERSVSAFMKKMIISYTQKSTRERERILFKKRYEKITYAINNRHKLNIVYDNKILLFDPYLINEAIYDYGSYVVGYEEKSDTNPILLIRKIKEININIASYEISEKVKLKLKEYKDKGVRMFNDKEIAFFNMMMHEKSAALLNLLDDASLAKYKNLSNDEKDVLHTRAKVMIPLLRNIDKIIDKEAIYLPVKK